MKSRFFLDTNIFVYSFDAGESKKRARSIELIDQALKTGQGVVSTQVIQEFFNVATKKFIKPMSNKDCQIYLTRVFSPLCEVFSSIELYHEALNIHDKAGYSFYDSLILAAAIESKCDRFFTEDLQHGQKILDVEITNPFI